MKLKGMGLGNWKLLLSGIGILFVGLIYVALVGASYHGIPALIASSLLILGVITIFWSLSTEFE
ncbi:MAG: hypothetical protein ACK4F9_06835 [Brevinematia bacterium]